MKRKVICLISAAFLSVLAIPFARADDEACADGQTKTVETEAYVSIDNGVNPNADGNPAYDLKLKKAEGQVSFRVLRDIPCKAVQEILVVIRGKMHDDVVVNGMLEAYKMTPEEYLKGAYIELKRVGGLPMALIIGANTVPYGQDFHGTLDNNNDAAHALGDDDQGQVKGFTIVLDREIVKWFDHVEAAGFTSNPDFFKGGLSHLDGIAFRVSKTLADSVAIEASYLHKENAYDPTLKPETKVSLGATYRAGLYTIYGEGVFMKNGEFKNSPFGITSGVHRITGPGQIDLEGTAIVHTLRQFASGYELYLSRHFTVGPTFRYTYCFGGNAGCMTARGYGQGPSLNFSAKAAWGQGQDNPTWLGHAGVEFKKLFVPWDRNKN
jgi:hypothetical protein